MLKDLQPCKLAQSVSAFAPTYMAKKIHLKHVKLKTCICSCSHCVRFLTHCQIDAAFQWFWKSRDGGQAVHMRALHSSKSEVGGHSEEAPHHLYKAAVGFTVLILLHLHTTQEKNRLFIIYSKTNLTLYVYL